MRSLAAESGTTPALNAAVRLPVLDGLRGMVLFVLLGHFSSPGSPPPDAWARQLYHLIAEVGVCSLDMFFALSGFLITGILLDTKHSSSYARTFYARRFIRIFPLYYAVLLAYFVILPVVIPDTMPASAAQQIYYWTYTSNVPIGLDWFSTPAGPPSAYLTSTFHLWSLAVEEQFYLVWPAVVLMCDTKRLKRVALACMVIAPLARCALAFGLEDGNRAAYFLTPARMDGLALGALIAVLARQTGGLDVFLRWAGRVAAAAGAIVVGIALFRGHYHVDDPLVQSVGMTASVYLGGSIILVSIMARTNGWWHRLLAGRVLRQIGLYSYAIYVLHEPLGYTVTRLWSLDAGTFRAFLPGKLAPDLAFVATMMVLSILAGALSWHLFEKRFLALKRYLPYAYEEPKR